MGQNNDDYFVIEDDDTDGDIGKRPSMKIGEPPVKKSARVINVGKNSVNNDAKRNESTNDAKIYRYTNKSGSNTTNNNSSTSTISNNMNNGTSSINSDSDIDQNEIITLDSNSKHIKNKVLQGSPMSDISNDMYHYSPDSDLKLNEKNQITPDCCTIRSTNSMDPIGSDEGYCNTSSSSHLIGSPSELAQSSSQISFSIDPGSTLQVVSDESDVEIIDDDRQEIVQSHDIMYINSDTPITHQTIYSDEPSSIVVPDSVESKSECQEERTGIITENTVGRTYRNETSLSIDGINKPIKPIWFKSGCFNGKNSKQAAYMLEELAKCPGLASKNVKKINKIISHLNNPNPDLDKLRTQINTYN